jgi:pectin methylesterase-like acyl-CoA thioesterase
MTIENAFDYPANAAKPDSDKTKLKNQQAVALMTDLGSDRAVFENVKITGYQDTLFPNSGRSYFHACEVWGHVDFIFGAGIGVRRCTIVSRDRGSKTNNGCVTAPSTKATAVWLSFVQPSLRKRRRWRRTPSARETLASVRHAVSNSVAFLDCWMDDHIGERGWDRVSSVDSTGTRVWYNRRTRDSPVRYEGPRRGQWARKTLTPRTRSATRPQCVERLVDHHCRGEADRIATRALLAVHCWQDHGPPRECISSATRRWPTSRRLM